jgi:hypothetical protein
MKTTVLTINQTKEEKKVEIPIDGKSKTKPIVSYLRGRRKFVILMN